VAEEQIGKEGTAARNVARNVVFLSSTGFVIHDHARRGVVYDQFRQRGTDLGVAIPAAGKKHGTRSAGEKFCARDGLYPRLPAARIEFHHPTDVIRIRQCECAVSSPARVIDNTLDGEGSREKGIVAMKMQMHCVAVAAAISASRAARAGGNLTQSGEALRLSHHGHAADIFK
jgi:hypothetical protein